VREAKERLAELEAVFSHGELLRHALRLTLGRADIEHVESAVRTAAEDRELIRADDGDARRWTTPRARYQEQRAIEAVLRSTSKPLLSARAAEAAARSPAYLTSGQREAVRFALGSDEQFKAVVGRPGAGKTTMMSVVARAAEERGWLVRGMAQNAAAAKNLETEAGIGSTTVHKLLRKIGPELVRVQRGEVHWWERIMKPRELWVVDEASQLPNALLSRLIWAAQAKQAQVLFVGDNKQLSPIEAGRPFDLLLAKGMKHVEMDQMMRQRDPEELAAIRAVIRGDMRSALDRLGDRLHTVADRKERLAAMVQQWTEKPDLRDGTLLLTSRHQDRVALNEAVRAVLRKEGMLSGEHGRVTLEKAFGSRADTREIHHYREGQVLHFPAGVRSRGISNGEYLRVARVDAERGTVQLAGTSGRASIEWNPRRDAPRKQYPVGVYEPRDTTLAVGEKVRWLLNSRGLELKNGEVLTVESLATDRTTFRREDGSIVAVPTDAPQGQHWTHAYASTVYRAQGLTAQRAIANLDSDSGKLLSQKAFLVAISRHREGLSIYTDSRDDLENRLWRETGEKSSAIAEIERHNRSRDALVGVDQLRQQRQLENQQQRLDHLRQMER
jgi:ATP-dependent exoDNAse (exonuclease V) alpha subunit